ncbi:MAG: hypothetical protein CL878_09165 [Dehalococcoidia bacterium]|nr:hypothetical protein [Dehalococcoidia bacterium]
MATKKFDPHDPFDLMGTPVPPEAGHDSLGEMARCFIEEYLQMGWPDEAILKLFGKPKYRGPNAVYRQRGEAYVRQLIVQEKTKHAALMDRLFGEKASEEA